MIKCCVHENNSTQMRLRELEPGIEVHVHAYSATSICILFTVRVHIVSLLLNDPVLVAKGNPRLGLEDRRPGFLGNENAGAKARW